MGHVHPIYDQIKDPYTPPAVGDTVKVSVCGQYIKYDVLTVTPRGENYFEITASRKGVGSTRFTWDLHATYGYDSKNRKYYLVNRN